MQRKAEGENVGAIASRKSVCGVSVMEIHPTIFTLGFHHHQNNVFPPISMIKTLGKQWWLY